MHTHMLLMPKTAKQCNCKQVLLNANVHDIAPTWRQLFTEKYLIKIFKPCVCQCHHLLLSSLSLYRDTCVSKNNFFYLPWMKREFTTLKLLCVYSYFILTYLRCLFLITIEGTAQEPLISKLMSKVAYFYNFFFVVQQCDTFYQHDLTCNWLTTTPPIVHIILFSAK